MSGKIKGRLQTPVDGSGNRKDIHLITTSDEVLVPDGANEPKILTDVLGDIHTSFVISSIDDQPSFPTVWFRTNE